MFKQLTRQARNGLAISFAGIGGLAAACHTPSIRPHQDGKEFEGVITYAICHPNDPDSALYGDTVKIFYSHGNMIKEYNDTSPTGLKREVFLKKGARYYLNIGGSDTLYDFDITARDLRIKNFQVVDTSITVLGYPCETILYRQSYKDEDGLQINSTYSYSKNALLVNAEDLANWKFGNFDVFVKESGHFYMEYIYEARSSHGLLTKRIFHAVHVQEQWLDSSLFSIGNKPVKEFKIN